MVGSISASAYRRRAPGPSAVYAIGRSAPGVSTADNPFAHTACCTLECRARPPCLHVFAADASRLSRAFDAPADRAIYLIGRAAHSSLCGDELLRWCGDRAMNDPPALRQLFGGFVLLVDDRATAQIVVVSDALGARPWFIGRHGRQGRQGERFVGGTDVLGICDAGLSNRRVDYDSLGSWLCYNFVAGDGSVVEDFRRVRRGTVARFDPSGVPTAETIYAPLKFGQELISQDELTTGVYERLSGSFEAMMRGVGEVNLPLSGGYDSRLLGAMAAGRTQLRMHLTTVGSNASEVAAAQQVAQVLGLPWQLIPRGASLADFYDDPLWFGPEGLPTSRNLTNVAARRHPGVAVLSGFLGDTLTRGPTFPASRAFLARDDTDQDDHELAMAAHVRYRIGTNRLDLLRDGVEARAQERGRASLLRVVREGREAGRPLAFANLRLRQCKYFAGIFLSHLDVAGAILPYCTWELMDFHTRHVRSFTFDTSQHLFLRHFPKLAHIPHDSAITPARRGRPVGPTRHLVAWAAQLLRGTSANWRPTGMVPHKVLRRAPEALLTGRRYELELTFLYKVYVFEERLRQAGVDIDWSKV